MSTLLPFADLSDSVAREIVWAFAAIILALLQLWTRQTVTEMSTKAQEVKDELEVTNQHVEARMTEAKAQADASADKLTRLATIAADTHTLVNDRHGKALKLAMDLAVALADARNTPEAREVAAKATQDYEDHEVKQAVVDSQEKAREGT